MIELIIDHGALRFVADTPGTAMNHQNDGPGLAGFVGQIDIQALAFVGTVGKVAVDGVAPIRAGFRQAGSVACTAER